MHCLCDKLCGEQLHHFCLGNRAEGFIVLRAILFSLLSVEMQSLIRDNTSQAFFTQTYYFYSYMYIDLINLSLC